MDGSWVPSTPGKPICTDRQENEVNCFQSQITSQGNQKCNGSRIEIERLQGAFREETNGQNVPSHWESTDSGNSSRDSNSWEAALPAKPQVYGATNPTIYSRLRMDDADKLTGLSYSDLLALATGEVGETGRNTTTYSLNAIVDSQFEEGYFHKLPANSSLLKEDFFLAKKCRTSCVQVSEISNNGSPILFTPPFDLNSPPRKSVLPSRECIQSQFAPITPDQATRAFKQQFSNVAGISVTDTRDVQEKGLTAGGAELNQLLQKNEQSQLIVDQLSAGISTELQENHAPDKGGSQGSDSNRTPQQKPRRKKHRPKVVIEGQPKRKYVRRNGGNKLTDTPEKGTDGAASTVEPPGSEKMPVGKRKYVRRKGLPTPTKRGTDGTASTTEPPGSEEMPAGRKYVRKKELATPTEKGTDGIASTMEPPGSEEMPVGTMKYTGRNGVPNLAAMPLEDGISRNSQMIGLQTRSSCRRSLNFDSEDQVKNNSLSGMSSNFDNETHTKNFSGEDHSSLNTEFQKAMESRIGNPEVGMPCDLTCSQMSESYLLNSNRQGSAASTAHKNQQPHYESAEGHANEYTRGKCQIAFSTATHDKEVHFVQMMMNTGGQCLKRRPSTSNCSTNTCLNQETQAIGSKRQCLLMNEVELCSTNVTGAHYNSLQTYFPIFSPNECISGRAPRGHFPVIHKKRRTEKGHRSTCRDESSGATNRRSFNHVHEQLFTIESCHGILSTQHDCSSAVTSQALVPGAQENQNFNCLLAVGDNQRSTKKRSKGTTRARFLLRETCQQFLTLSGEPTKTQGVVHQAHGCMESTFQNHESVTTKKRSKRNSLFAPPLAITWKPMPSIDEMIDRFRLLDISALNSQLEYHYQNALTSYQMHYPEQNALVVYQRDGTIVPFNDSFVPRKRKPRPKVDLDDETSRVWRLLLEDINSEGIDGTDEEKAKWWEEERKVFCGRADSFIARMHLVQGDRRFSPWKGSVLDSVIGVFLTQNVSDHLSSSAFMSLAAQYPLKSNSKHKESTCIIEEPVVHVPDPDDAIAWHEENSNLSASGQSSITQPFREDNAEKFSNSPEVLQSSPCGIKSVDNSSGQLTDSSKDYLDNYQESAFNGSDTEITQPLASSVGHQTELEQILSSQYPVDSVAQTDNFELSSLGPFKGETKETKTKHFTGSTSFVELLNGVCSQGSRSGSFSMCSSSQCERDLCTTENTDWSNDAEASVSDFTPCSNSGLHVIHNLGSQGSGCSDKEICATENSGLSAESANQTTLERPRAVTFEVLKFTNENEDLPNNRQIEVKLNTMGDPDINVKSQIQLEEDNDKVHQAGSSTLFFSASEVIERSVITENSGDQREKTAQSSLKACYDHLDITINADNATTSKGRRGGSGKQKQNVVDWDCLRKEAETIGKKKERTADTMDSLDWEAIRCADVKEIAETIKARGMNNKLAERIKDLLDRLVREHGSTDLEWLRDVPPDKAKEYLLSVRGLGLKSVECVRLLTLHHLAFPVDTNVGRIAVRLGWVPLQPLPESLQLHLLELYPVLESIQKYLWPRLCKLDQRTLYELHYQMITFGKVFCTKSKPNCNACPMRGECRHFASAFASARLALPEPEEKTIVIATENQAADKNSAQIWSSSKLCLPQADEQNSVGISSCSNALAETNEQLTAHSESSNSNPIVVIPATPEPTVEEPGSPEPDQSLASAPDIEEFDDPDEIPTIKLNMEEFTQNLQMFVGNTELQEHEMSKALVALTAQAASIPMPKLKNIRRLRTEHHVYELPDSHPLLQGLDLREPDDPCPYLLAIWTPGETVDSVLPPERICNSKESGRLCDEETCFSCNSIREANSQTVRGTLLIPCRTATRGSFPLNGTYFQVNEVFADHDSSLNPIDVPRAWIWNLPRRTVYFGTSVPTIFKGLSTEEIQYCFWRGFVCVRGFEQKTRAPRPLIARLHFPASRNTKTKEKMDVGEKMQTQ